MQIPIQSGVTVKDGRFVVSYPVNLRPKALASGLSKGQLVSAPGAIAKATGPGADRGGLIWRDRHFRAMGSKLVEILPGWTISEIGEIGGDCQCTGFDYSFDRLAIRSGGSLYYYDGTTLTQVTDTDLGEVRDLAFIDGYFVTTDGEFVVVTELLDPTQIEPLKYGSAESDPDEVTGVMRFDEELLVFGRHTIQPFRNVGSTGFPFQTIRGAVIPFGCISAAAKTKIASTYAFVGGGRGEPLGVFIATGGTAARISDDVIEELLAEAAQSEIKLEARREGADEILIIHMGDQSAALSLSTSRESNQGAWHILQTDGGRYTPRHAVLWNGEQVVGHDATIGVLSIDTDKHFGVRAGWSFDVGLQFNDGRAFIVHDIELFGQFPREKWAALLSMTRDGETWSNEVARHLAGRTGERVAWRPHVRAPMLAGMRFRGTGRVAVSRCDVTGEGLMV